MGKHKQRSTNSLKNTLWSKPRAVHALLLVIGLAFGTALVTQVKASQSNPLETLNETELIELMTELDAREADLNRQLSDLEAQLRDLDSQADSAEASAVANERRIQNAQIDAGAIPVHGPGIRVNCAEAQSPIPSHVFVTTLAELRNAGAEAIEINGVRLTGRSWFLRTNEGLVVDDVLVQSPFVWLAIGSPDTLAAGVDIRGGAVSQMRLSGAVVSVDHADDIVIDSIADLEPDRWAQPIE